MPLLNEPLGWKPGKGDDWTPGRAFVRGLCWGVAAALGLGLLLGWAAAVTPALMLNLMSRTALAFAVAWVLIRVVQRGAGMEGGGCVIAGIVLMCVLLLAQHAVFAVHGVPQSSLVGPLRRGTIPGTLLLQTLPLTNGRIAGWCWFWPIALVAVNGVPLPLGGWVAAALSRRA